MKYKRNRPFYLLMIFIVICLGLLSRKLTAYIPDVIDLYLGDLLWALMVYLFISMLFASWPVRKNVLAGILFCFLIEFSQLYHSNWIDMIRNTTLGGLVLGYGFLWSDLSAYLLGIGCGAVIDVLLAARDK